MIKSDNWEILYICDTKENAREYAAKLYPKVRVVTDSDIVFRDTSVEIVVLAALANSRKEYVNRAIETGKHIIAEKPLAPALVDEWEMVKSVEESNIISTGNLNLRNSWYHDELRNFVKSGEIGDLAIIRVCHMTSGLAPGEGHEFEGPAFHDCGMHYVDIARWYAESEFKTWHSQGLRMWDYKDPWWIQCHGTFKNGIVFDITQGFVYGQLSKDQTHNSYIDIIGTKGVARISHDFKTALVDLRGETVTRRIERPFGGKNIAELCSIFAESVRDGTRSPKLPTFRVSAIASEFAWKFLANASDNELPAIGDSKTLKNS